MLFVSVYSGVQLDRIQAGVVRPLRVPDVGGRGGLDPGRLAGAGGRAHGRQPDLQRPG